MSELFVFPFSAIVGQDRAKLALLCNAVNPAIGGVLLCGDKGCGKSTMVRALADVLPEIEVVKGCRFNCNPKNEFEMCESCRKKAEMGELEVELRKMVVVDLPLSVTVDRLVGTIDFERALKEGIKALQPGILAQANRNILYIDEVNLIDDYVADVLLDSAAMGWNIVEREGISLKHPARFVLVGSMNPEEGELRPQILDRFGLYVRIEAMEDIERRMEILSRVEEFQNDPWSFRKKFESKQREIRESVDKARKILPDVVIDDDLIKFIVKTVVDFGIRTHRAEIVTLRTAKAIAALDGRKKVSFDDVKKAVELALPHRMRDKSSRHFQEKSKESKESKKSESKESKERNKRSGGVSSINRVPSKENRSKVEGERESKGSNKIKSIDSSNNNIKTPDFPTGSGSGSLRGSRGERVSSTEGYGIHIFSIPGKDGEIDVFGSLKNAILRKREGNREKLKIVEEDLLVKVKRVRVPRLTLLVLDASGSMLVRRRISLARAVAKSIIKNSYVKRDSLSLIVFKGLSASTVVKPTRMYSKVLNVLEDIEFGGKTPLTSALKEIRNVTKTFRIKNRKSSVRAILITDGKANVSTSKYRNIREEIVEELEKLLKENIKMEVYDTRQKFDPAPSFTDLMEKLGVCVRRVESPHYGSNIFKPLSLTSSSKSL